MKRGIQLLAVAVLLAASYGFTVIDSPEVVGEWNGSVVAYDGEAVFLVHVYVWDEDGQLHATLDVPDYNQFDLPVEDIRVSADKLYLKRVSSSGAAFVFEGSIQDGVATGAYARNGKKIGVFLLAKSSKQVVKHQPLPAFEVHTLDDERAVSNATLAGHFYLIDFWATTCSVCVGEMAHLHEAYEQYKDRNFTILSLSVDESPEEVQAFHRDEWAMPWPNAHLSGRFEDPIAQAMDWRGTPTPLLISPEGIVLARDDELLGENLAKTLARYLGTE